MNDGSMRSLSIYDLSLLYVPANNVQFDINWLLKPSIL